MSSTKVEIGNTINPLTSEHLPGGIMTVLARAVDGALNGCGDDRMDSPVGFMILAVPITDDESNISNCACVSNIDRDTATVLMKSFIEAREMEEAHSVDNSSATH